MFPPNFSQMPPAKQKEWLQGQYAIYDDIAKLAAKRREILTNLDQGNSSPARAASAAPVGTPRVVNPERNARPSVEQPSVPGGVVSPPPSAAQSSMIVLRIHAITNAKGEEVRAAEVLIPGYGEFTATVGKELPLDIGRVTDVGEEEISVQPPAAKIMHVTGRPAEAPAQDQGLSAAALQQMLQQQQARPSGPRPPEQDTPAPPGLDPNQQRGAENPLPPPGVRPQQ
jgi:hypothetical protein